jgi:hypothetical protein
MLKGFKVKLLFSVLKIYNRSLMSIGDTWITFDLNFVSIEMDAFSVIDTLSVTSYTPASHTGLASNLRMSPFDPENIRQVGYVPLKLNFLGPQKSNYSID